MPSVIDADVALRNGRNMTLAYLTRLSWRNVWRQPRRSGILILTVAVGTLSLLGSFAFMDGMMRQMLDGAVVLDGGTVQIAHEDYQQNPTLEQTVAVPAQYPTSIVAASPEIRFSGMGQSASQSVGARVIGIDTMAHPGVSDIRDRIVEGGPLRSRGVWIGAEMAKRLRLRIGDRFVLMASDIQADVQAAAFDVVGIFRTADTRFDRSTVFLTIEDARRLTGIKAPYVSTISLKHDEEVPLNDVVDALSQQFIGQSTAILTWQDRNAWLEMSLQAYDQFAIFLAIILFVAVAFTFANAFLMVMLERMRETGVVMAIGLRPALVRLAYIIESLITATSGIILALLLGTPVYLWLNHTGIDLGSFATGLNAYGIDATVYPSLDANRVWMSLIVIFLFTTIAVVYPAMKASRTQIVEALRHV